MTNKIQPLDDDALELVTGGNTIYDTSQCDDGWSWDGFSPEDYTCSSCRKAGTSRCPKNN